MSHRAGLDRARVLAAAAGLVDASGAEALSLAALAERLGVRTPSLYNYVAGLPGLRRDLALAATRKLGEQLARSAVGKAGDEAVRALADALRAFIVEHPGSYELTIRSSGFSDPADAELEAAQAAAVSVVTSVLAAYHLEGPDALHASRGLRSIVHGFATLELARGFGLPLDLDESFRRLIQMYLAGLRPRD